MEIPKKPTILLIDEDAALLDLMTYVLADEFQLLTCRTPEDGLSILMNSPVDCLLLDIDFEHTPECLGLLGALPSLPKTREIAVVATSAVPHREVAERALQLGARCFIPKPFRPSTVLAEVRAATAH